MSASIQSKPPASPPPQQPTQKPPADKPSTPKPSAPTPSSQQSGQPNKKRPEPRDTFVGSQHHSDQDTHTEDRSSHLSALAANFSFDSPSEAAGSPRTLADAPAAGGKNCIDRAAAQAQHGDQALFLHDNLNADGNNAGHVVLQRDGHIIDGEQTYASKNDYLQAHSQYSQVGQTSAENLQQIVNSKTPAERQAAIQQAGLQGIADERFADPGSTPPGSVPPGAPASPPTETPAPPSFVLQGNPNLEPGKHDVNGVPTTTTVNRDGTVSCEYDRDGKHVVETLSRPDSTKPADTRLQVVEQLGDTRTTSIIDTSYDPRSIEELNNHDPRIKPDGNGPRSQTQITHTQVFSDSPKGHVDGDDTTSYKQSIGLGQGDQFKFPGVVPGGVSLPGGATVSGFVPGNAQETLTFTTSTKGPNAGKQSLRSDVWVQGKNDKNEPATIAETTTQNYLNGNLQGGTRTNDYRGVDVFRGHPLVQPNLLPGGNPPLPAPVEDVPESLRSKLPQNGSYVNARTTVELDASGHEVGNQTTQYGNYDDPHRDGATVTRVGPKNAPAQFTLDLVSQQGRQIDSQTVWQGSDQSAESHTSVDKNGNVTTTRTVPDPHDPARKVTTSSGTRTVTAQEIQNDPSIDPELRKQFLAQGGQGPFTMAYSNTREFDANGPLNVNGNLVASNASYTSASGVRLDRFDEPYAVEHRAADGQIRQETDAETTTVLYDPKNPTAPVQAALDTPQPWDEYNYPGTGVNPDRSHPSRKRSLLAEAPDGTVTRDGTKVVLPNLAAVPASPDGVATDAKRDLDYQYRHGINLALTLSGKVDEAGKWQPGKGSSSKSLGAVSALLAYSNLFTGGAPTLSEGISAATGTGTLLKLPDGHKMWPDSLSRIGLPEGKTWPDNLVKLGKGLGYAGNALTTFTGIADLFDPKTREKGAVSTAMGVGGILTTVGGPVAGPAGWALLAGTGAYVLLTAEDRNKTAPITITSQGSPEFVQPPEMRLP